MLYSASVDPVRAKLLLLHVKPTFQLSSQKTISKNLRYQKSIQCIDLKTWQQQYLMNKRCYENNYEFE